MYLSCRSKTIESGFDDEAPPAVLLHISKGFSEHLNLTREYIFTLKKL